VYTAPFPSPTSAQATHPALYTLLSAIPASALEPGCIMSEMDRVVSEMQRAIFARDALWILLAYI